MQRGVSRGVQREQASRTFFFSSALFVRGHVPSDSCTSNRMRWAGTRRRSSSVLLPSLMSSAVAWNMFQSRTLASSSLNCAHPWLGVRRTAMTPGEKREAHRLLHSIECGGLGNRKRVLGGGCW